MQLQAPASFSPRRVSAIVLFRWFSQRDLLLLQRLRLPRSWSRRRTTTPLRRDLRSIKPRSQALPRPPPPGNVERTQQTCVAQSCVFAESTDVPCSLHQICEENRWKRQILVRWKQWAEKDACLPATVFSKYWIGYPFSMFCVRKIKASGTH